WQHVLIELTQKMRAFRIRANAEQLLLESKISRQRPRKLKRDWRIQINMRRLVSQARQFQHFKVQSQTFRPQFARGFCAFVQKEIDFGLQKCARIVELLNLKAVAAIA